MQVLSDEDYWLSHDEGVFKSLIQCKSDILPGQYEGGLKTWECAIDLAVFIADRRNSFRGKNVCEIGCGAGLPGIAALNFGSSVTFFDFNEAVISLSTFPNVFENLKNAGVDLNSLVNGFSGDWNDFQNIEHLRGTFDIVLASETIYNPESYPKLIMLIEFLLKPDAASEVWLAAKNYYFGVGGGVSIFEFQLLQGGKWRKVESQSFVSGVPRQVLRYSMK